MAISEFEQRQWQRALDDFLKQRRPPPHIRDQLDLDYRIEGQNVEIFEVRPLWNDPGNRVEQSVAKATYVKSKNQWKVFWQRADLKWHRYDPAPTVASIEDFLDLVNQDAHACFFG